MIRSRNNPQVRAIRRLRNAHTRKQSDLLLLEGRHLVEAGAEAGLAFRHLLATPDFRAAHAELIRRLEDCSGTAAALIDPRPAPRAGRRRRPPGRRRPGRTTRRLALCGTRDPRSAFRPATSTSTVSRIQATWAPWLAPPKPRGPHPFSSPPALPARASRAQLRASAGSLLRIPVWTDVQLHQVASGASWFALTSGGSPGTDVPTAYLFAPGNPVSELSEVASAKTVVVAVGNESRGLSTAVLERSDLFLQIAMVPTIESLNATVAASLAMFELQRLRRQQSHAST